MTASGNKQPTADFQLNWPNALSAARLLLTPAMVYFLASEAFGPALLVFAAAGASDALDGYLARRLNQATRLGAILDAVADKLMILSSLAMLAWLARLPPWLATTVLGRDVLVLAGAALAWYIAGGRLIVAPSLLGKLHTALEFIAIAVVLAHEAAVVDASAWRLPLFALLCLSAIGSGLQYARRLWRRA